MKHIALLLIALSINGCVYHQINLTSSSSAEDYHAANELLAQKRATVYSTNSQKIKASHFDFRTDSLTYKLRYGDSRSGMASSNVFRVQARNPGPYMRNGALIGALPGGILGTLVAGYIVAVTSSCTHCEPTSNWYIPLGTVIGASVGAAFGTLAGAANTPVYTVYYSSEKE